MDKLNPSKDEMLESLNRSGYLMESSIAKYLMKMGFFVESNQVIIDPLTQKSREIDLMSEFSDFDLERNVKNKCYSKIKFIFEIKNNAAPVVLMTEFDYSPNVEHWNGIKQRYTYPEELSKDSSNFLTYEDYYDEVINGSELNKYTQYCSFQNKRNKELMALHPENLYQGLNKITQYAEEQLSYHGKLKEEGPNGYFRNILYLPVIILADNLFELRIDKNNKSNLKKTDKSILIHNYYYNQKPNMAYVLFVTMNGFERFISEMLEIEKKIENKMIKYRQQNIT